MDDIPFTIVLIIMTTSLGIFPILFYSVNRVGNYFGIFYKSTRCFYWPSAALHLPHLNSMTCLSNHGGMLEYRKSRFFQTFLNISRIPIALIRLTDSLVVKACLLNIETWHRVPWKGQAMQIHLFTNSENNCQWMIKINQSCLF
jgi:hypothetical protein